MYGNRDFEGAQVYADGKLVAIMTWDNSEQRTYARDIKYFNPNVLDFLQLKLMVSSNDQLLKLPAGTDSVEFRVVTKDGRTYLKRVTGKEDVAYFQYNLNDFQLLQY